jgi:hypothetical protein
MQIPAYVVVASVFVALHAVPFFYALAFRPLHRIESAAIHKMSGKDALWFGYVTSGLERNAIAPHSWAISQDKATLLDESAWITWGANHRPWWCLPGSDGYAVIGVRYETASISGKGHLNLWPAELTHPESIVAPMPVLAAESIIVLIICFVLFMNRKKRLIAKG